MKKFRTIIAFFQVLLTLLGFCIISVVIFLDLNTPYNIITAIAVFIVGLFASRVIFNMMQRRGVVSVMTGDNASYDLDELEPSPGSGVMKLTPEELINLFSENELSFNQGLTVSIWGDWEGRKLDERHQIVDVEFEQEKNILTISFSENCSLKIKNPKLILLTNTYLKIVKAKEVLWQIPNNDTFCQYSYLNTSKIIETKSNTDWKPHKYDLGIGMNAIYLKHKHNALMSIVKNLTSSYVTQSFYLNILYVPFHLRLTLLVYRASKYFLQTLSRFYL